MIRPLAVGPVFAGLSSALLLTACTASVDASSSADAPPAASGEVEGVRGGDTRLSVGQTLHIALPSNATTGYQWTVSGGDPAILTPADGNGQEVTDAHAPGMVGVGGSTHWRFTAARAGNTTLTFKYARAWERDTPPAETATYRVTVR